MSLLELPPDVNERNGRALEPHDVHQRDHGHAETDAYGQSQFSEH